MMCPHCTKTYTRNTKAYFTHTRHCSERVWGDSLSLPSTVEVVLHKCLHRIAALEKEVSALKNARNTRVKPLEWLDAHFAESPQYLSLVATSSVQESWLDAGRDDIACFTAWCAHTLGDGLDPSMRCFRTLPGTIFGKGEDGWCVVSTAHLGSLVDTIRRKFLVAFKAWSDMNPGIIRCDRRNDVYFTRLQKITDGTCDRGSMSASFGRALYSKLVSSAPPGVTFEKSVA